MNCVQCVGGALLLSNMFSMISLYIWRTNCRQCVGANKLQCITDFPCSLCFIDLQNVCRGYSLQCLKDFPCSVCIFLHFKIIFHVQCGLLIYKLYSVCTVWSFKYAQCTLCAVVNVFSAHCINLLLLSVYICFSYVLTILIVQCVHSAFCAVCSEQWGQCALCAVCIELSVCFIN